MYGPKGLGKLSAGGHPRRLTQQDQPQNVQNSLQTATHKAQVEPNRQPEVQQQQQVGSSNETRTPAQVVAQDLNQVSAEQTSKDELSQAQRSQEQHSQQQVKQQFSDGAQGAAGQATQAVPIKKADCFATFNPPTVEEYQEVWSMFIRVLLDAFCPKRTTCSCFMADCHLLSAIA